MKQYYLNIQIEIKFYLIQEDEENRNQEQLPYVLREYMPMGNFARAFHHTKVHYCIYKAESKMG
jgi:hypothetical protein